MLTLIRLVLLVGFAASGCIVVLGAADLTANRWKRALVQLGIGLAGFSAGVMLMRMAAVVLVSSLVEGHVVSGVEQAQFHAIAIATQTNFAAIGFAVGALLGAALAVRRRRAERAIA